MTPGPRALPWVALGGHLVPGAGGRPGRGAPYPACPADASDGGAVMGQLVQIFGSVLILVSFGLAQLQKLSTRSRPYLTLNLAGSAILAADAAAGTQWGFLLLEGAWALVSLLGLAAAAPRRGPGLGRRLRPR